jgi:hypothetical protein
MAKDGRSPKALSARGLHIQPKHLKEEILMPEMSRRNIPPARFGVIRQYQPARIERELLAQVFDVAERGSLLGELGDLNHRNSDEPLRARIAKPNAADSLNLDDQPQSDVMEAVA